MKKVILVALLVLMTAAVFAAGSKEASDSPVTISFGLWDENQKPALQKVVDQFNAEHNDIQVVVELTPWGQYWTKLDAAAGAGEAPDVFWMNVYLPKYVDGDVILPLDDLIAKDGVDLSGYVSAVTGMYNYEGSQWAMPKGLDSVAVALNTAIFKKYNVAVPEEGWTWNEMKVAASRLRDAMKKTGEYPILMELDAQPSHFNFTYQTGGNVINDDYTKSGYNLAATTKAYQNVVDLFDENLLAPYTVLSETKGTDLFLSQRGAILFVGSWKSSVLENSEIGKAGAVKLITMPKQDASNASVLGGLGYAIYKHSDHPEEAWEFVKYITGEVGNKIQAEAGIDIPALKNAQKYYLSNFSNINADTFFKAAENAVPFPAGPDLVSWIGIVNDYAAQIFAQEITAEQGTASIYKEMQAIIEK